MILMNGVDYPLGSENVVDTPLRVFDTDVCAFIAELSSELLKSPASRAMPDLAALAFWGRRASLQKMAHEFDKISNRLGRGVCFHIAPSNIPINFAFSYLFALLAGNANIVRLPSKDFPQIDALCTIIGRVIRKYPEVEKRTAFVRYPRNSEITAAFCARADVRMIWGGDNTIAMVKALPASPRCVDVAFADRYSLALLDGKAVLKAKDTQLQRLVENFYNDTFLMDQNACSSPQVLLWQHDDEAGRERFWNAVDSYARKKYILQDAVAVDKYTALCEEAISNPALKSATRKTNLIYRVELKTLTSDLMEHRGHGGFFYEYSLKNWEELFSVVTEKFQTVTCFGVDKEAFCEAVVAARLRGIDRIVPVGKAMDIGVFWDGHDLVRELSRIVKAN